MIRGKESGGKEDLACGQLPSLAICVVTLDGRTEDISTALHRIETYLSNYTVRNLGFMNYTTLEAMYQLMKFIPFFTMFLLSIHWQFYEMIRLPDGVVQ